MPRKRATHTMCANLGGTTVLMPAGDLSKLPGDAILMPTEMVELDKRIDAWLNDVWRRLGRIAFKPLKELNAKP